MISRAERGPVADWARSIDRWLLGSFGALMVIGLVMALAASPAVAERLNLPTFHFVNRQALLLAPTALLMIVTSFLSPRHSRRAALIVFAVSMALILAALMFGAEVKGSRRWIAGIQPSEFIKPAFVILAAWAFAESGRAQNVGLSRALAFLLLPVTIIPLIMQPDFGQTMLVSIVWAALFFMAGLHWFWVVGLGGVGAVGGFLAFKLSPHVHERVLRFLDPDSTGGMVDTFQVDTALQSILSGGWLGRGPGEGVYKRILPDAHTDFVFAVTGEEFGMIACLGLIAFFGLIVMRGLWLASRNEDPFCRFAAAGLVIMFGVQSWINMAVNIRAVPAKGMTLPFISYGGSSLLALGLGMGFLIALTRKRPNATLSDCAYPARLLSEPRCILIAAGGTGGHLFPAQALALALGQRGLPVELATDERALKYGTKFPARAIHTIPSATPTGAGLVSKAAAVLVLARGVAFSLLRIRRIAPLAVVGFGGYPTVPPLLAAALLGLPTLLHEQNAVMGRANRFLAARVRVIATGFPTLGGAPAAERAKIRYTGNPVRPAVLEAAAVPYPDFADGRLCVLVTGGSQGARVMADIAPAAIALLSEVDRARVSLTQQARGEDRARVADACARMNFPVEIAEFFPDLPARIAAAHLVIGRAGASTVSELAVIGRPSILVPFPHALDQDQAANAAALAASGAAQVIKQSAFTPELLAGLLREALAGPGALITAAAAAKAAGVADAAERLADLVQEVCARGGQPAA